MTNSTVMKQDEIDAKNAEFWNQLCGSHLAQQLGIVDDSQESLKKFDDWYFDYYPYLLKYIPVAEMSGQDVLEIGLGYGTVAQKIAEAGARYHGLDIATGPVGMAQHRCRQIGIDGAEIRQGSVLTPPFENDTFDWIVAIGCLHHTGNLARAIKSVHSLLRSGGRASIMVYSATSYRQLTENPLATLRRKFYSRTYVSQDPVSDKERGAYDTNTEGEAAPQTEFVTKQELRQLCRDFAEVRITTENIGGEGIFGYLPRDLLCRMLGRHIGLDLYCQLRK